MAESKVEHLLDSIHFPEDLRHLSQDKLEQVCADLRQYIIDVLSENPGHLGASLGTVELTVALHYVFNTPYDRIVWDVVHQAYGHKILTGRKDIFHTLRRFKAFSFFRFDMQQLRALHIFYIIQYLHQIFSIRSVSLKELADSLILRKASMTLLSPDTPQIQSLRRWVCR